MVISEALAAGIPAVLWDLPSFERFNEGVIKVPYPDIDRFSKATLELLSDVEYRKAKGSEARRFAMNNLSWEAAASLELKAIKKLTGLLRN
jgi:glycosyltransferase involved in cell wall biosynthesis